MFGRHVEGPLGIGAMALAPQVQPTAGVQVDVAGEVPAIAALRLLVESDARFQRVVEILARDRFKALGNMNAQRVRGFDLLASDCDVHGLLLPFLPAAIRPAGERPSGRGGLLAFALHR